jgi:predicted metalloprotease with PDZ domain
MKKILTTAISIIVLSGFSHAKPIKLKYTVNLNERADNVFRVTLDVSGLGASNSIYQFASTAPGTYQVMDIGRFVKEFKALDKSGNEIPTKKIGENQYELSTPSKIKKIEYKIAETWDAPVDNHVVYKMSGSSLEQDNVLINGQCVFGYPKGWQQEPMEINLQYPAAWMVGTALSKDSKGHYIAENFDKMVDSPILLGRLTRASTKLGQADIEVYTYSKTDQIKSENLLGSMEKMLHSADSFIGKLPVNRYVFLFHFENETWGAWEHSYSSEYIFKEQPYTEEYATLVTSTAAHEFFHVITPLNIHSEIIEPFNFVTPVPSEHLWLYEGTTEWASDIMQLRSGMMTLDEFLGELQKKLVADSRYDTLYSLSKLSLTSYTEEGERQYPNIYMRGAVVASLLDIRLLELSGGTKGLREVILDLSKKYGPHRVFPEKDFFKIVTDMTYPQVGTFFEDYVKEAKPLPLAEYYGKLGIRYIPKIKTGKMVPSLGTGFDVPDGKIRLAGVRNEAKEFGLMENDELVAIDGTDVTLQNGQEVLTTLMQKPVGSEYQIKIRRAEEEKTFTAKVITREEIKKFIFEVDPTATEQQLALRKAWMKNL